MSRSYRKTTIFGNTTSVSEKSAKKFVVAVNYSPLPSVLTIAVFTEGVEVAAYQGNNTLWRSSGYP